MPITARTEFWGSAAFYQMRPSFGPIVCFLQTFLKKLLLVTVNHLSEERGVQVFYSRKKGQLHRTKSHQFSKYLRAKYLLGKANNL